MFLLVLVVLAWFFRRESLDHFEDKVLPQNASLASPSLLYRGSEEKHPFRNISVYRPCLHEHLLPWVGKKSQTKVLDGLVDHIYVVTTYEGERRELMKKRLGKILPKGWEEMDVVSFISIGDLTRLTTGMWHCFHGKGVCQYAGAVAISMSNYAAHYSSVYHGYDRILVLEDDVNFKDGFVEHMAKQIRLIEKEPYRKYIRADPGHLERPEKLDYFTPEHLWDQVMLR
jgi:hypothetical protein